MTKPVIALMGPTASGKTALAMELVEKLPVEIISVDSAMVYQGMDIGTGKPTADELAAAPHRLIDICDPADAYSAARFAEDAMQAIADVQAAGNIPLLVGGTFLYFRSLLDGFADMPPADAAVREQLAAEAGALGWAVLHARLAMVDPVAAARIHSNDAQRIQRALEVWVVTGRTLTDWHSKQAAERGGALPFSPIRIVYAPDDRAMLHRNIEARFGDMLSMGFVEEVERLFQRGDLTTELPSIRSVGYRQIWNYVSGDWSLAEARERGIIATRQLAKRQFTWLRNQPMDARWFNSAQSENKVAILEWLKSQLVL